MNIIDELFIKLVDINGIHKGITYYKGLNKSTTSEKLIFYHRKNILWLIDNAVDTLYYIWDVEIPVGETIYENNKELYAQSFILTNRRCIWHDKYMCIASIVKNPWILEFAHYQTDDMCLRAVMQNGMLLQFVRDKIDIICLAAVERDGIALQFVDQQTREICLASVRSDPYALRYVNEQTPQICIEAVRREGMTLKFVKNKTYEICMEAVKQTGWALQFVDDQTEDMCIEAIKHDKIIIGYVKNQTPNICRIVYGDKLARLFIDNKLKDI